MLLKQSQCMSSESIFLPLLLVLCYSSWSHSIPFKNKGLSSHCRYQFLWAGLLRRRLAAFHMHKQARNVLQSFLQKCKSSFEIIWSGFLQCHSMPLQSPLLNLWSWSSSSLFLMSNSLLRSGCQWTRGQSHLLNYLLVSLAESHLPRPWWGTASPSNSLWKKSIQVLPSAKSPFHLLALRLHRSVNTKEHCLQIGLSQNIPKWIWRLWLRCRLIWNFRSGVVLPLGLPVGFFSHHFESAAAPATNKHNKELNISSF